MNFQKKKITLIIPCYNEYDSLDLLIEKCNNKEFRKNIDVILVDNGSTDNTQKLLSMKLNKIKHIKHLRLKHNRGYGFGILTGIKRAKTDFVGWTHADLQTDPLDLLKAVSMINKFGDNIFIKGKRKGRPFFDTLFTIGMSIFESIIFKKILWDINAQPTILHKSLVTKMINAPDDFLLDLYTYVLAKKNHIPFKRIEVNFKNRLYGKSKWNINYRSKIKFILRTIKYSIELKRSYFKI